MKKSGKVHIGTSGWHYRHWIGPFYPPGTPSREFFGYYLSRFSTVEINNTFYRLPREEAFIHWKEQAPKGFTYALKASRFITHMKKLKDTGGPLEEFLKRADLLGDRLGPILFQLPPHWRLNPERLEGFLKLLPRANRYAFEFRDPSWLVPEVHELLRRAGAGFCIYDIGGRASAKEVTADFVYIRLHGPGEAYEGQYSISALGDWAGSIDRWLAGGLDVYCYFDNDEAGYAAKDALRLLELLNGLSH